MLTRPAAPATALPSLQNGLPPFLQEEFGIVNPADGIVISLPQPLYATDLQDFASGEVLSAARLIAWQFVVLRQQQPFGLAEVVPEPDQDNQDALIYGGFEAGPYATSILDTITFAESLPQVSEGDYELRMLRVPGVYLYAVWLHGADDDLILPCDPAPEPVIANQVMTAGAIVDALQPLATYRLELAASSL